MTLESYLYSISSQICSPNDSSKSTVEPRGTNGD
jgi:hypothetical protein